MSLLMCMGVFAQDYLNPPKAKEKVIGIISIDAKSAFGCTSGCSYSLIIWYDALLKKAQGEYPNKVVDIRGMELVPDPYVAGNYYGPAVGKVIDLSGSPESQSLENLSKAMDKAFRNVREGSRVAIDMVTVSGGVSINREDLKDQIIDALLDKGYKVVAKDYLEKMYEEQEAQQSGIYNESTTVKTDNFSAVGYYINVKVTEASLRVQVVNVSTGEYEGNATVNF